MLKSISHELIFISVTSCFSARPRNQIFIFRLPCIIFLIRMITHIFHDVFKSQPGLRGSWNDLIGREEEAVATGVAQLEGEGVFGTIVVTPVNASTTGLI